MNAHARIEAQLDDRFEIVTDAARLAEIGPAWNALWRQGGDGLVFQSHDWVSAWWQTVPARESRQLRIGLVWRGTALIAILPLAVQRRMGLRFLEWAANDCTDYADILLDPACPPASIDRLWRQVVTAGGFDLYYLNRLRPDAKFRAVLDSPDGPRLRESHRTEICSQVSGDWTAGSQWFDSHTKKSRQNYRRGRKALEEAGPVTFRFLAPDEPVAPVLARLAELKRKWLVRNGRVAPLFDEGAPALPALVDVLARAGVLRLFVLECGGTVVAISVNFIQHGTLMAFLTTYDPEFERGSPGMVLLMDYVQWSIDQGLREVDFLCGSEAFKRKFATTQLTLTSVMGPRTLRGRLALLADRARDKLRATMAARSTEPDPEPAD